MVYNFIIYFIGFNNFYYYIKTNLGYKKFITLIMFFIIIIIIGLQVLLLLLVFQGKMFSDSINIFVFFHFSNFLLNSSYPLQVTLFHTGIPAFTRNFLVNFFFTRNLKVVFTKDTNLLFNNINFGNSLIIPFRSIFGNHKYLRMQINISFIKSREILDSV